jgi:hypothetical protein
MSYFRAFISPIVTRVKSAAEFGHYERLGRSNVARGIDLIRLAGEGNSVVLRTKGRETRREVRSTDVLTGEFVVDTPFISGTLNTWLFPADLTEWQQCLDALDSTRRRTGHHLA